VLTKNKFELLASEYVLTKKKQRLSVDKKQISKN